MKRRKNLERAIVLGLLLSTSVYGSAWAEDVGNITGDYNKEFPTSVTVKGDANSAIEINNKKVNITTTNNQDGTITLESGKYGIRLEGESYVTLTAAKDNEIIVTLDNKEDADGINAVSDATGTIKLTANGSNIITTTGVGTDGIYTDKGNNTVILLSAANNDNNNKITAGNNGIDHRGNNTVTLTAKGGNIITAGTAYDENDPQGDGVRIQGDGTVTLDATYNKIIATDTGLYLDDESTENAGISVIASGVTEEDKDLIYGNYIESINGSAIQSDAEGKNSNEQAGNIEVEASKNIVIGKVNAVYNSGNGTITISAKNPLASEGISTLADYIKYDNVLIAGENGVKSDGTGETNVIAGNNNYIAGTDTGILSDSSGTITVTAGNNNYIGQYTDDTGTHTSNTGIKVTEGTVNVTANNNNEIYSSHDGIYSYGDNNGKTENKISLTSNEGSNIINTNAKGSGFGIYAAYTDEVKLTAKQDNSITLIGNGAGINSIGSRVELIAQEGSNKVSANGEGNTSWGVQSTNDGYVKLDAEKDNEVSGVYTAILAQSQYTNNESKVVLVAGRNNNITADEVGIQACFDGNVDLTAETGNNIVKGNDGKTLRIGLTTEKNGGSTREEGGVISLTATANNNEIYTDYRGIDSVDNGQISLSAGNSNFITGDYGAVRATEKSIVSMSATNGNNTIISVGLGEGFALEATSGSTITANAAEKENKVVSDFAGIYASGDASQVSAIAGTDNIITADSQNMLTDDTLTANYGAGNSYAVYSEAGAAVNLQAANANKVSGAVYANGSGTDAEGNVVPTSVTLDATENNVYSAAVIDGAGGLAGKDEDPQNGLDVVSALYAENGAKITVSGNNNFYTYYSDPTDTHTSERVVWAYDKANINIDGYTNIGTTLYNVSPNSKDIAIAAGTAVGLNEGNVNTPVADVDRATVTLEYDDSLNGYMSSNITGDILSAYAGLVNIKAKEGSNASINITGNLLSGNNGKMTVNLGNGGRLTGRIDDYGDAGTVAENGHLQFFDPAFSSDILTGGEVNLEMGNNSYWNVTGQSWVTSLSGEGSIIDMRNDNENLNGSTNQIADENTPDNNSHAVHIGTLTGSNTFVMDLNDNSHSISDMLYIKDEVDSSGTHTVFLNSIEGLENMQDGDKLRFATVNAGAEQLAFVGDYKGENGYTGSRSRAMLYDVGFNDVAFEIKNEIYSEEDTENEGYNGEEFGETKPGNDYVDAEYGDGATNWYLTRNSSGDEISDGGKTILNMSRANYSNAIYMDRLNKRLGEARYINSEEEDGMWVRIRHDRIGKTDAYRSQNTMYELGYDKKQDCDNGERRVGFAVDYMHGDTGYSDIAGKGEIDRYGLWLYDTWMGNKGHYVDYVAKWGHLSNDFEIYNSRGQVTGDYSNNVFSISAEYGRKKDMGNDWYIEPQAQLQLARVTGADYVTSQGTKVSVDGINSLIGRAGFRLGKDFGEEKQSTVYIKADVLHEFLGDQTIRALDGTTGGDWQSVDYENKGTWYDIGIGYAAMLSQSTYAFIDLEQSFGNDNDDTYQINAGVRWTF